MSGWPPLSLEAARKHFINIYLKHFIQTPWWMSDCPVITSWAFLSWGPDFAETFKTKDTIRDPKFSFWLKVRHAQKGLAASSYWRVLHKSDVWIMTSGRAEGDQLWMSRIWWLLDLITVSHHSTVCNAGGLVWHPHEGKVFVFSLLKCNNEQVTRYDSLAPVLPHCVEAAQTSILPPPFQSYKKCELFLWNAPSRYRAVKSLNINYEALLTFPFPPI